MENQVMLAGDVSQVTRSGFLLTTVNEDINGNQYEQKIPIVLTAKNQPSWLKNGCKAELEGQISGTLKGDVYEEVIIADPGSLAETDEYMNMARLIGTVGLFGRRPPSPDGKQAFANLAINVAKNVFRAVLFDPLAVVFERRAKKGMRVEVRGPLQNREWVSRAGITNKVLETRADSDWTRLLDSVESFDPFAKFGKGKKEQAPAGEAAF